METGSFEKQIVLTPDLCGRRAGLSPLAAFTIFQGIASEHAEAIGVGGAAMAKRGEFWLTVHSRVDFYEPAYLMDALTAQTWPERCEGRDIRCFRSYRLTRGEKTVALGRTQWAILGPEGKILRFEQSGFPADFPFRPGAASILNIASVTAHKGYVRQAAYAASKHAMAGFTKTLAAEVYEQGIRVHLISPGGVFTDMAKVSRPDLTGEEMITAEDIAEIAAFLVLRRTNAVIDEIEVHRANKAPFA